MDPQINLDGSIFHKPCAKCGDCNCQITISNFTKNESSDQTVLLCKIHYFKRFHEGGSYLGGDKYQKTAQRDATVSTAANERSAVETVAPPSVPGKLPVKEAPAVKVTPVEVVHVVMKVTAPEVVQVEDAPVETVFQNLQMDNAVKVGSNEQASVDVDGEKESVVTTEDAVQSEEY